MKEITLKAHRALQCRDYSLFDFRVHAETKQPYVIECCAFWSFSPISAISLMLQASNLSFERMIVDIWRMNAKEPRMLTSTESAKEVDNAATSENGSASSTTARSR